MFGCLFKTALGEDVQDPEYDAGKRDPGRESRSDDCEISEPTQEPKTVDKV